MSTNLRDILTDPKIKGKLEIASIEVSGTASPGQAILPDKPIGFIRIPVNGVYIKIPFYRD